MMARILLLLVTAALVNPSDGKQFDFVIDKQWNGTSTGQPAVKITLIENLKNDTITFMVKAPFYNDAMPEGHPSEPNGDMWKHEVAEFFFLNEDSEYFQLQLGPFGHYMVLLFDGERDHIHHRLPLDVDTTISNQMWEGKAVIPTTYLPPRVTKFNAFMQNGPQSDRKYWALYPADDSSRKPNLHQLKYFKPIGLEGSYAQRDSAHSDIWLEAHKRKLESSASAAGTHFLVLSLALLLLKCH